MEPPIDEGAADDSRLADLETDTRSNSIPSLLSIFSIPGVWKHSFGYTQFSRSTCPGGPRTQQVHEDLRKSRMSESILSGAAERPEVLRAGFLHRLRTPSRCSGVLASKQT